MSNCVIDRRGFVLPKTSATTGQVNLIREKLFVTPLSKNDFKEPESYTVYTEDETNFYLPRYWGLQHINSKAKSNFIHNSSSVADFKFNKFSLRSNQIPIVDTLVDMYHDPIKRTLLPYQNKIINIGTGMGKTVLALFMMCFLKRKAIIIVHTEPLETQWFERIDDYVSGAKIGYIQGKKYEIEGCNIIVVKVQSLMSSSLNLRELLKDFDLIIYDEAHHYASKVFSNVLRILPVPYTISLTATLERSDKMECVLHWSLGEIGYKIEGQLDYNIDIKVIKYNMKHVGKYREVRIGTKLNIGAMMTNLTVIPERTCMIVREVRKLFNREPERNILMVSHRVEHLFELKELLEIYFPNQIGMIIGKKNQKRVDPDDLREAHGKKIILGIYNLVKEGLDIATICSVWLLTPMSAALQICGRMLRKHKTEYIYKPLIVEIMDGIQLYQNMHYIRLKQYIDCYLQASDSSLAYYDCNHETNYKMVLHHKVNLSTFAKDTIKPKDNPFDSDED